MIAALLHGKLSRKQENMEDLLTSTVFGLLEYLPPRFLGRFLALACSPDGVMPLADLVNADQVKLKYWPALNAPGCSWCEPDVLLDLNASGSRFRVLIEAKYLSGKSSFADDTEHEASAASLPPKDQLAREWENLAAIGGGNLALVYLTADAAIPRHDIEETQKELLRTCGATGRILWLSWRHLFRAIGNGEQPAMLVDILSVLRRLGLTDFEGVRLADIGVPNWRFTPALREFRFDVDASTRWNFETESSAFSWRVPPNRLDWRFNKYFGRTWPLQVHALSSTNWRFKR